MSDASGILDSNELLSPSRVRDLEIQIESIRTTQLEMQRTLHEILSQLRERPTPPTSHASVSSLGHNSTIAGSKERTESHPSPEEFRYVSIQ